MTPQKILVIRFSAMGDVMLLVPVLSSLVISYPDVEITLVTRPRFSSLFKGIDRLKVFEADVDYTYNGVLGMRDLFKSLMRKASYDVVIDLHDHIRTMILRSFFKIFGTKVIVFDKGRAEKKAFVRKENKITSPLPHTVDRYHAAFRKAGFDFAILPKPFLKPDTDTLKTVDQWLDANQIVKSEKWIGIAPFAMHMTKIWPKENYEALIEAVSKQIPVRIFFFGGGEKEIDFFENLREKYPDRCAIVAGQLKIRDEIALLQRIDLMLCVDSSNMHLAALTGTPLLSLWGGTDPDVGFGPYQYGPESILQISRDELSCRPCSVYGKEKCFRGDFACFRNITVSQVASAILKRLDPLMPDATLDFLT
ncbi:MAG TPA: glycosyltransferase family 9 protein [Cyclobacteriaceae bacterium]|nr:glycosyltransferase family 9 protein [Cyclobacteriaceae bacterium]